MQAKPLLGVMLLAAVLAASFYAAGQRADSGTTAPSGEPPAVVEQVPGTELQRVVLSARAAERLGIAMAPAIAARGRTAVPYAAVLYDTSGGTWVYTSPEPLVFVRARVRIDYIDGAQAVLSEGPPTGTDVVTVGGAQLLGAEFEGGL